MKTTIDPIDPRQAIADQKRQLAAANAKPVPTLEAVRVLRTGMYGGSHLEKGSLAFIWPEDPAPGFLRKESARSIVEDGLAVAASAEEISAFLEEPKNTTDA